MKASGFAIFFVTALCVMSAISSRAASAEKNLCEKIVEVKLGGFGDTSVAKIFRQKFGDKKQYGAIREDTYLTTLGNFKTKKTCKMPASFFVSLHYIPKSSLVLVETLEGTERQLELWDVETCRKEWNATEKGAKGQPIWFHDKQVIFRPTCWDCNSQAAETPCQCDSALVLDLKGDCVFAANKKDSDELTKKEIGVSFTGSRKVINRFTTKAQLK